MKISITTNEILIPKRLFKAKVEKELEFDTTLEDFCPDIARLIRVDCTPFSEGFQIDGDKAISKGRAVYDILYETDYKNKLKYCSFTQEFSHSLPLSRFSASDLTVCGNIDCERISCRLLSPRRLVIKSVLGINLEIEGETAVKAVAVNESRETFFRKKTVGFEGKTRQFGDSFNFSEELQLSRNEKAIGEVLCGNIRISEPSVNLSAGVADIKTTASVRAICEEEDNEGKYFAVSGSLPLNLQLKNEAIADYKQIEIQLTPTESAFRAETDQYGENRIVKAVFSVNAGAKIREPKAYTLAEDIIEKGFESHCVKGTAVIPVLSPKSAFSFTAEGKSEDITPKPLEVLDCSAKTGSALFEKSEGEIRLKGNFVSTLLLNTEEGIYSFDRNIPFEHSVKYDVPENAEIEGIVKVLEAVPNLHSDGSVTLRVIASAEIISRAGNEEAFISEVTKRTPIAEAEAGTLIYRFPQQNEDLWAIAKSYGADPEEILRANPESFDEQGNAKKEHTAILIKI